MRVRSPTNIETGNKIHSWGLNVIRLQDHRDVLYSKTRVGSKALSVLTKMEQSSRKINKSRDPVFPQDYTKIIGWAHCYKISTWQDEWDLRFVYIWMSRQGDQIREREAMMWEASSAAGRKKLPMLICSLLFDGGSLRRETMQQHWCKSPSLSSRPAFPITIDHPASWP